MNERQKAEKKAMELMGEKEGTDLMYLTGYRSCHDKAIPIVADLLIREAELEIDLEKQDKAYDRVCDELSASQKRVEQLQEKLNFYYRTLQRRLTWEKVNIYHTLVI